MSARPLLEVEDLAVTFPGTDGPARAVRSLSFAIAPGEVLGLVGESGSGKTVSSLAIMDLLPRQARVSGSVRLEGQELMGRPDRELSLLRGRRIAMIFQDPLSAFTPVYTVGEQIAEAILIHQPIGRVKARARAVELLDSVGIPNPQRRAASFPHEFSGGMRQRAMIAMAIANDPALIIADEPTTALDVTIQAQVLDVLRTVRARTGAAVLLITHDLGVVAGLADRVAVMYAGKLVEAGSVDDVFHRARMPYTLGLLGSVPRPDRLARQPLTPIEGNPPALSRLPPGCPFSPRCPLRIELCREAEPALLAVPEAGSGHLAACHRSAEIARDGLGSAEVFGVPAPRAGAADRLAAGEPRVVLAVHDLVKEFPVTRGALLRRRVGTLQAVAGVSFELHERETLGLVGESGCGKTTTIMEILNMERPQAGTVQVLGHDTARMSARERWRVRRDIQVVFQDPLAALDPRLPVADIIGEPLETHGVAAAERAARIAELLRLVGLEPEHAQRYPQAFSGGQRQRIGIARALALQPQIVVLDEPVSALDVSIRAGIINLLERLQEELGLAYLFVAHDLAVVRHTADRVAVMYLGAIVEIGAVDEVFEKPLHPYTQALLSAIPLPDPRKERARRRIILQGDLPSPLAPPSGCRFHARCPRFAQELDDAQRRLCIEQPPALAARAGGAQHLDACHYSRPGPAI
ncbi:MAG TPA: ABC transporter ATP-binding protein [Steroidobacteraceae bacterium]|nr:ABC transporter ATP-binding protein [Steroidobacteraceae bacterium]